MVCMESLEPFVSHRYSSVGVIPVVTDFEPLYPTFLGALRLLAGDRPLAVQIGQAVAASLGAVYLYLLGVDLLARSESALLRACCTLSIRFSSVKLRRPPILRW